MDSPGRLAGKVAVVTGGNSGIGLATARRFAAEGAQVYITGRRQEQLDEALRTIAGDAIAVQGDVRNLADLDRLLDAVRERSGRIDILHANAGLGEFKPLSAVTEEHFDLAFAVNVKGTLFTVQRALPLMKAGGSIILTGSTAGSKGTAAFSVYAATKAAIRSFARNWALDLKGAGIRINILSPGPIDTPGARELFGEVEENALSKLLSPHVPLGRIGHPDEVAAAALFLATDESSFINGIELFVDGGTAQV